MDTITLTNTRKLRPIPDPKNALRRIRIKHGLTLMQMAEIAGSTYQAVWQFEHEGVGLGTKALCRLSDHFGYSVQQILDPDFDPKKFA